MRPLEITVPSGRSRVVALTPDDRMKCLVSGRKLSSVLRKARKMMGSKEPMVVIVPQRNVTHIF